MALLWYHLIVVAICLVARIFGVADNVIGFLFVIGSSFATSIYIINLKNVSKKIKLLLLVGFFTRIVFTSIFHNQHQN